MSIQFSALPKKAQEQIRYAYPGDKFVKRNKYSARSCKCWNKAHAPHMSILESDQCNVLYASGVTYETQYKLDLVVNGLHITNYYVDFVVFTSKSKRTIEKFIETKGYETPEWKIKKKLVDALFPKIKFEVLRQRPGFWKAPK